MNDIAIRAEGLSKKFHIGKLHGKNKTLRETVMDTFTAPVRKISKILRGKVAGASELDDTIWALKDVSFEIKQGEVIGIIGRNGAGKSTLLKILSRITEPTRGFAEIHGRISSLLEVGTGFHSELTGRENIYLNSAILGMKRAEIDKKFDEIVAFAEVEKFLDTPVKHYSSGMYLRLAFAVAAHLEPEILLVDEVLAVGDARFQKKCLDKMETVGKQGRTVLFVSHNMPAVTRLCKRVILLNEGKLEHDGSSHQVVSMYLSAGSGTTAVREWKNPSKAPKGEVARLCAVRVKSEHGKITGSMDIRKQIILEMEYDVIKSGYVLQPDFGIINEEGIPVFVTLDQDKNWRRKPRPKGHYISQAIIPGNFMSEGTFFVGAGLVTLSPANIFQFNEDYAVTFQVVDSMDGDSARGDWAKPLGGIVRPLLNWNTQFSPIATI
ncbi:Teichoic acids export ATP-binding protein TagH [Candidatus Brocadiaceae bacterium B188]|jgi:lipopolysaccharide transport system ATP-binding protein|nr:ABC transporter ATP-binding protein [Candidatus Brocadia sapporoensis]OQZ02242.1 MAG: ABC transporter [Candidatus Brocadia sp. UTAMX1]RZV59120.1 MAG: ABC transporter ATP-binding protein [Candidatus Brocadia sp. BROELEC01]TWU52566.1 Teichoic acids export ATP-binding protein TagH [Candidatus Brocadiaceae bacterium B188]